MSNKELIERIDSYLNLDWDSPIDSVVILLNCKKALQDAEILREGDVQGRNIIIRQLEGEIKELRLEAKKQAAIHLDEESKLSELISYQSFAIDQRDRLLEVRLQEINRLKAKLFEQVDPKVVIRWMLIELDRSSTPTYLDHWSNKLAEQFKKERE